MDAAALDTTSSASESNAAGLELNTLESQLSEVEMLLSMYSQEGEMELDDPSVLVDLRALCDAPPTCCKEAELPPQLGFVLNVMTAVKNRVEIVVSLPHAYPRTPPDISVLCSAWTRAQHSRFTDALHTALRDFTRAGDPCVVEVVRWILDNADEYIEDSGRFQNILEDSGACSEDARQRNTNGATNRSERKGETEDSGFTRLWIYSHHIYNSGKRRMIVDSARELNLTGFSVAGKPGLICVEGERSNAEEFWQRIRALPWQRIGIRHREDASFAGNSAEVDSVRKFERFEEKSFEARQCKGRMARADFGLLFQFLQERGFGELFRMYFGVNGKETEGGDGDLTSK